VAVIRPGVGFDDNVGLEPILAPVAGLVRVPSVRVHGRPLAGSFVFDIADRQPEEF
jgi:hypothetical protein